jgi:hypothetical protein
MSVPAREDIRTRLRQAARQVDQAASRVIRRFVPVGDGWSGPPPAHQAYLTPDHQMCCAYHEEHSFWPVHEWRAPWQPDWRVASAAARPIHPGAWVSPVMEASTELPAPTRQEHCGGRSGSRRSGISIEHLPGNIHGDTVGRLRVKSKPQGLDRSLDDFGSMIDG